MYLLGWLTSLGTAYFVQYLKNHNAKKEELKQKRAFAALFIAILVSYELQIKLDEPKQEQIKLWEDNQAKIAFYFPDEAALFALLSSFLQRNPTYLCEPAQQQRILSLLYHMRAALKQRYNLKDLQETLEKML